MFSMLKKKPSPERVAGIILDAVDIEKEVPFLDAATHGPGVTLPVFAVST